MGKRIDLTGKTFGSLTVIGMSHVNTGDSKKQSYAYWKVRCECGKEYSCPSSNLRSGNSTRCNECRVKAMTGTPNESAIGNTSSRIDLTGEVFGELTVLGVGEIKKKVRKDNSIATTLLWEVQCSCGRKKNVQGGNLRRGTCTKCNVCRVQQMLKNNKKRRDLKAAENAS
jgi:hypothetical protein